MITISLYNATDFALFYSSQDIKLYCSVVTRELLLLEDRYLAIQPNIVSDHSTTVQ